MSRLKGISEQHLLDGHVQVEAAREAEQKREEQLIRIFDYLGFSYETLDECILLCEKYMKDNKRVYETLG